MPEKMLERNRKSRRAMKPSARRDEWTELDTTLLLQLRVLRLGLLQDGDVGVGVSPEGEEIVVGVAALGNITGRSRGASEAQVGERADRFVEHNAAMVEDFLELGCCS